MPTAPRYSWPGHDPGSGRLEGSDWARVRGWGHRRCATLPSTRASGGIGRRAGFRFLCPKGREGSSPSSRTPLVLPRSPRHRPGTPPCGDLPGRGRSLRDVPRTDAPQRSPRWPPPARSSTPSPTRPRPWPPTPCCRSSRRSPGPAGVSRRDPRHLPGRPDPGRLPRGPRRATSASPTTWPSWVQLVKQPEANIIKLPNISASIPQLNGDHRGAARQGLRRARLPRRAVHARGGGGQGPLRQGQGQRGQPRAARGQLRPPGAGVGEELRPQPPPLDGCVVAGLQDPRGHHGRGRLPLQRDSPSPSPQDTELRIELVGRGRHGHAC